MLCVCEYPLSTFECLNQPFWDLYILKGSDDGIPHSELPGLWTLYIVRYSTKWETQRFGKLMCFLPQGRGKTLTPFVPLERALTKGPNWVGVFPPTSPEDKTDPVSETFCLLVFTKIVSKWGEWANNETSSNRDALWKKPKCRKYHPKYVPLGGGFLVLQIYL
jgi:hypothetical protein